MTYFILTLASVLVIVLFVLGSRLIGRRSCALEARLPDEAFAYPIRNRKPRFRFTKHIGHQLGNSEAEWVLELFEANNSDPVMMFRAVLIAVNNSMTAAEAGTLEEWLDNEASPTEQAVYVANRIEPSWFWNGVSKLDEFDSSLGIRKEIEALPADFSSHLPH